jgi:hypothetical protein
LPPLAKEERKATLELGKTPLAAKVIRKTKDLERELRILL